MSTSHGVTKIILSTGSIPQEIIQVELLGSEIDYRDSDRAINIRHTKDHGTHM